MIECSSCHTLNSESERVCLACSAPLPRAAAAQATSATSTTQPTAALRCPAGHPIDPSWKTCPYCSSVTSQQGTSARSTRGGEVRPNASPASSATRFEQASGTTRLEELPAPRRVRKTSLQEVPDSGPAHAVALGRLVAVLAAPGLGAGGSIFPIRAGKTTLGGDRSNQVPILGDSQVSGEHAVLLYRDGVFHLSDRFSTNGTWVNGLEVPANGTVTLADRDQIRLGNSNFILLIVDNKTAKTLAFADSRGA